MARARLESLGPLPLFGIILCCAFLELKEMMFPGSLGSLAKSTENQGHMVNGH